MKRHQWKQWPLMLLWSTSASFSWAESPENLKDVTRRYLQEKRPAVEVIMEGSYYDAQEGIDVIKVMIKEDNQVKGLKALNVITAPSHRPTLLEIFLHSLESSESILKCHLKLI